MIPRMFSILEVYENILTKIGFVFLDKHKSLYTMLISLPVCE